MGRINWIPCGVGVFFGLMVMGCSEPPQPSVLRADDLRITVHDGILGAFSAGQIEFNKDGDNKSKAPNVMVKTPHWIDLKWTGLDLDYEGEADDTVYFTLKVTARKVGKLPSGYAEANDDGWGVNNPKLFDREILSFEVEDVRLSGHTAGTVEFTGFTGGRLVKLSGENDKVKMRADINGQKIMIEGGAPKLTAYDAEFDPASEIVFTVVGREGEGFLPVSVRAFDLQFNYTP